MNSQYLLQLQTSDFQLQLTTEILADSLFELQREARKMVASNSKVIGCNYRIFKRPNPESDFSMVKEDVITG